MPTVSLDVQIGRGLVSVRIEGRVVASVDLRELAATLLELGAREKERVGKKKYEMDDDFPY
jgi:hypothetical protein